MTIFLRPILLLASLLLCAVHCACFAGSADAMIGPEDKVRVRMKEDLRIEYDGPVSLQGTIPLPFLGEVSISGQTTDEAATTIEEALTEELYQAATVSVALILKAPGTVYVYGAVRSPGAVRMPKSGRFTMLQLIPGVGGVSNWALPEESYIMRDTGREAERKRIEVDVNDILTNPSPDNDVVLQANDILFVPGASGDEMMQTEPVQVFVIGEVNRPGIVMFAPGEAKTILRAILKSGGFGGFAKKSAVRLIRYGKRDKREEIVVDVGRIMNQGRLDEDVELEAGDMIIIDRKMINF